MFYILHFVNTVDTSEQAINKAVVFLEDAVKVIIINNYYNNIILLL